MKPSEFDYAAPESLDGVLALLGGSDDAKVLAGGQSLVPLLNFRLASPALLVDLQRVPGMDAIERKNGNVVFGAMVRQRAAEERAGICDAVPLLCEALRHVAHPQIRSRGTIGGSVAHADPAAELPALLVALDGRVAAASESGTRWIDARDLYTGFLATSLAPAEVITAVELPVARERTGAACVEVTRRAGDYALCGALTQVTLDEQDTFADVRVALLGVGPRPVRARAVEERLRGERASRDLVEQASLHGADDLTPWGDSRATAEYRRHLARVLVRRSLELALGRAT